jgi:cysteine desulfurase / selenocysteine lyase
MKIDNKKAQELRKDFPIFKNNPNLIYLDNAATSQRPQIVIDTVKDFAEKENANVQRGLYTLSEKAMEKYKEARKTISIFINAKEKEIIFTKNTTEALNLLAYTISEIIPKGKEKDEIVLSEMEHHSNLVPWQQLAKRNKMKLKFIKIKEDFTLDLEDAKAKISDKTAIVSIVHASNVLGTINPIKEIIGLAKEKKALTIIDAAQSVSHLRVDVKDLDCDFLAFSGHKLLGPTGMGVLYGKQALLEKLPPFLFGGGMIKKVTYKDSEWANIPEKFEAGTQNIAETIALAKAIEYIEKIGIENISQWESELLKYSLEKLKQIKDIEIYNPGIKQSISVLSFNPKGIHGHDVASLLNNNNIAIRAGHNCAMPLIEKLNVPSVSRVSLAFYNTFEDIDKLAESLIKIKTKFK